MSEMAYWDKAEMRIGDGEWIDITNVSWNAKPEAVEDIVPEATRRMWDSVGFIGEERGPDFVVDFRVRLTQPMDCIFLEIRPMTDDEIRTLRHVRRGCGPGGHKNSKASRRLLRALNGCA